MKLLEPQLFRGAGLVAIKMPRVPAARKKAIDGDRRPAPAVNLDPRTGQVGSHAVSVPVLCTEAGWRHQETITAPSDCWACCRNCVSAARLRG